MNTDREIHILLIEDSASDALLIHRVRADVVEFKHQSLAVVPQPGTFMSSGIAARIAATWPLRRV